MSISRNDYQLRAVNGEQGFHQVSSIKSCLRIPHLLIIIAAFLFLGFCVNAGVTSFPGASGGGAVTVGGRGGKVIEVTNLNDSGVGSLRAACEASGARTVVFRVGGIITLKKAIVVENSYITIAGQTAPGGGITIRSSEGVKQTPLLFKNSHDIIIRYIRVRPGPYANVQAGDCIGTYIHAHNIIIDHCSMSWGTDENTEVYTNTDPAVNITWSWNIISEALGTSHSCALLAGSSLNSNGMQNFSVHHNLFAHNHHRNPLLKVKTVEMISNIIYGWQKYATQVGGGTTIDIIANKYVNQPGLSATNRREIIWKPHDPENARPPATGPTGNPSIYIKGNIGPHNSDPNADAWHTMLEMADLKHWGYFEGHKTSVPTAHRRTTRRSTATQVKVDNAADLDNVLLPSIGACRRLNENGNFVDNRDAVDTRVINEYKTRTGSIPGTVTNADYPTIARGTPYADKDHDGMADVWESANGLNPNNASDRNGTNLSSKGFTNLEMFLSGTKVSSKSSLETLLLDSSTGANPNVQYIVTGDSTRDNSINKMIAYYTTQFAKINVKVIDNACSSQSCYKWINNIGSFDTYLSDAISATMGNGENTIMEFSFGLNELAPPDIKATLKQGITLYQQAKPKAIVILAVPVTTSATSFNAQLKQIYQEISQELGLRLIDTTVATVGVHGNSAYYFDRTHPNKWGSRRIVNYITDQILPSQLYSVMTLEEAPQQTGWMSIDDINAGLNIRLEKEGYVPEGNDIGITGVLGNITTNSSARATGPFTVSKTGDLGSLTVYHDGDNGNGYTLQMAVYADISGKPGTRLGITNTVQVNNSVGWQKVSLQSGAHVSSSQKVWLAWKFSVNPGMRFASNTGNPMRYSEVSNSLGSVFDTGSSSTAEYSLYATYSNSTPPPPPPTTYSLNVVSGSGDGNYTAGKTVTISANTPAAGKHFTKWTTSGGGSLANANSANTTYTMPTNNATATANYAANESRVCTLIGVLTFREVEVGGSAKRSLSIKNNGTGTLHISNVRFHSSVVDSFSTNWTSGDIAPGASKEAIITFAPKEAKNYAHVVYVDSDKTEGASEMNISGTGVIPTSVYTLTYTAGANGSITGDSSQSVEHGASGSRVTAVPDAGCYFVSWSDGVTSLERTETNVTANISVNANFASDPSVEEGDMLEDAEDGNIAGWDVYDATPADASISNVVDPDNASNRVIQLDGFERSNGFRYTFQNTVIENFNLQWKMKYSGSFTVYIGCQTTDGHKYITYNAEEDASFGKPNNLGEYIFLQLGNETKSGEWTTITRNLQEDLWNAQPDCDIIEVYSFLIRGSGYIDDITIVPDACLDTDNWDIYDKRAAGASITKVVDPYNADNEVIELVGTGQDNGFRFTFPTPKTVNFTIQWKMNYLEAYTIYIDCETTAGKKYITYTADEDVPFGNPKNLDDYAFLKLDNNTKSGEWITITRDLQQDLQESYPDLNIISVKAFLIRGSGYVDNIN